MSTSTIPHRKLGKSGITVPALGWGPGVMSMPAYGTPVSEEEQFKVLDRAYEMGNRFWDIADIYAGSEEMIGKWFKRTGKRSEIVLGSKFGMVMTDSGPSINTTPEHCRKQCEAALKKLNTDYIDVYYAHRLDPKIPVERTMRALAELKAEGKIRAIGLSEAGTDTLRRAVKIAPVDANQLEYSPFTRDIEQEFGTYVLNTCRELGVTVVAYSPLGRGLLTGRFTSAESVTGPGDMRGAFPQFQRENIEANMKILNSFKAFADKKGCSTSQLALAWLLKQGDDIIPIPGTKQIKYMEDNWGALKVHLTDEEVAEIRGFVESNEMKGSRSFPGSEHLAYNVTAPDS